MLLQSPAIQGKPQTLPSGQYLVILARFKHNQALRERSRTPPVSNPVNAKPE